jgi:hypothetical protein
MTSPKGEVFAAGRQTARQCCPTPTESDSRSFGAAVFAQRSRLGLAQSAVSSAAKVASGYFSEIENGKRIAPRRATATSDCPFALQFGSAQVQQLVAVGRCRARRLNFTTRI